MSAASDRLDDMFGPPPSVQAEEAFEDLQWFQKQLRDASIRSPIVPAKPEPVQLALKETWMATGTVLTMPSGVTKELAANAIEALDLEPIMRDIGIIVAREIADVLQTMALRPADYVILPDMPQMVAARIGAELSQAPNPFVRALIEQLKLRG
jgi:hypothetical protein